MDHKSKIAEWIASTAWMPVGICTESQPIDVRGMNPWTRYTEWQEIGEVVLYHPQYPQQKHRMLVYRLDHIVFATGELSNCVYGFFVPKAWPAFSSQTRQPSSWMRTRTNRRAILVACGRLPLRSWPNERTRRTRSGCSSLLSLGSYYSSERLR